MLNQVSLVGRLASDPDARNTQVGMQLTTFRLAVQRQKRDSSRGAQATDCFDISCYGKSAEFVARYLKKGALVAVAGSLQANEWEQDGVRQRAVAVNSFWVQALERRSDGEGTSASQPERPVARQEARQETQPPAARERPIADNDDSFGD